MTPVEMLQALKKRYIDRKSEVDEHVDFLDIASNWGIRIETVDQCINLISNNKEREEMLRAILAVGGGEAIFSPAIATRMMSYFSSIRTKIPKEIFPELTDREREILELIAHGNPNVNIAKELNISLKTVRNYVSNIYSKLQVADRAQAVIKAREAGMGN